MTDKNLLVDVMQLVHGWATVGIWDKSKILIHKELLDALKHRAKVNDNMCEPFDYWLIDGLIVREPKINGMILGSVSEIEITGKSVLRMSENSLSHLMKAAISTIE